MLLENTAQIRNRSFIKSHTVIQRTICDVRFSQRRPTMNVSLSGGSGQMHLKRFRSSIHVASLRHGDVSHSLISATHHRRRMHMKSGRTVAVPYTFSPLLPPSYFPIHLSSPGSSPPLILSLPPPYLVKRQDNIRR